MMTAILQGAYKLARSTVSDVGCWMLGHAHTPTRPHAHTPILLIALLMFAVQAHATPKPKVVMVLIPAVSLRDIVSAPYPGFQWLVDHGCIGIMNSRTAGRIELGTEDFTNGKYAPEAGYMTIGAGARTTAGADASKAYNADETFEGSPARTVFQRMALIDPGSSEVVYPEIARLARENSILNYKVTLGALGAALHKAGLKTAVIGNSDDGHPHREAVTIAMDENGLVDYGNVGPEMVIRDPKAPSGYRTNDAKLIFEFKRCVKQADFIVVELGDSARLDRARFDMMDDVYARQRVQALKRMDRMVSDILPVAAKHKAKVIVLSTYPSSYELEKYDNSLCPVLIYEEGKLQDRDVRLTGLLGSGSTRVAGVITNTDAAPSVVEWLGVLRPHGLVGRPISRWYRSADPAQELFALTTRTAQQTATAPVLRQAMVVAIILVAIVTMLWFIIPLGHTLRRKLIVPIALIPPSLALSMMLLALRPTGSQFVTWIGLIVVTACIVGFCTLIGRKATNALMLIALGTTFVFAMDIILGNPISQFSIMSYSIAEGARYYGIGNEFMGALIGASVIGLGLLMGRVGANKKVMQIVLSLGLVVGAAVIGAPMLGANIGGAISVIAAFGFALAATSKNPFDVKRIFGIILGVMLFLAVFAFLDSMRGQQYQSHLGRALQGIREGGVGEMGLIIKRKLAMNWMLISYSVWSRVLVAYVVGIAAVLISGKAASRLRPLPLYMRASSAGLIGGTLAALAFNDSGVVAAATCIVYAWSLIVLTVLETEPQA